jgi:hypothetical protein
MVMCQICDRVMININFRKNLIMLVRCTNRLGRARASG